ncbi:hypothetical protein ACEZDG_31380, partial [Streptacidiphilus sp. N1-1]
MVTYAEAQQRAEEWINEGVASYQRREVRVREFDLGFVAWAVDRADGPSSDGGAVRLVIARDSGATSLWPALPINDVVRHYEEAYGRPVGATPTGTPSASGRDLAEATSFLLSPPQWLEEPAAGAAAGVQAPSHGPGPVPVGAGARPGTGPGPETPPSLMVAPPVSEGPPGEVPTMLSPPPDWAGAAPRQRPAAQPGSSYAAPQPPPPPGPQYGAGPGTPPPPPPDWAGGPSQQRPPQPGGPGLPPPPPPGLAGGAGAPVPQAPPGVAPGRPGVPPPAAGADSLDYAPTMLSRPARPAGPAPVPQSPAPSASGPAGGPPPPPPPGLLGGAG